MSRRFSSSVQENLRRGEGDLSDLVSINIQRGRERGVPGYTKYRNLQLCGLSNVKSFDDLKNVGDFDQDDVENLRKVYDNVHDIDLFVGGKQSPSACVCVCACPSVITRTIMCLHTSVVRTTVVVRTDTWSP